MKEPIGMKSKSKNNEATYRDEKVRVKAMKEPRDEKVRVKAMKEPRDEK